MLLSWACLRRLDLLKCGIFFFLLYKPTEAEQIIYNTYPDKPVPSRDKKLVIDQHRYLIILAI